MRTRLKLSLVAGAVGAMAFALLHDLAPGAETDDALPKQGGASSVEHGAASTTEEVPDRVAPETERQEGARQGASSQSDRGELWLEAIDVAQVPVQGIRVALLAPRDSGHPWTDRQVNAARSTPELTFLATGKTGHDGICRFDDLPPAGEYQLAVLSTGTFCFEAEQTPLIDLSGQSSKGNLTVYLDRKISREAIRSKITSGSIPVLSGQATKTRVIQYAGASIHGIIAGGPWDLAIVSLIRTSRSVKRLVERRRASGSEFAFDAVASFGSLKIEAQLHRGNHVYFCASRVELVDGQVNELRLHPIDPSDEVVLEVAAEGDLAEGKNPFDVWMMLARANPSLRTEVLVEHDQPLILHGMRNARVTSPKVRFRNPAKGMSVPKPTIEGLVNGTLMRDRHRVVVFGSTRKPQVRSQRVALVPPAGKAYTVPHRVQFFNAQKQLLSSATFEEGKLEQDILADWIMVTRIKIQATTGDPASSAESRRYAKPDARGGRVTIRDPGPPNGAGIR